MTSGSTATASQRPMLIDGHWVAAASGQWLSVEDPAHRGTVVAAVPRGGDEDIDRACSAAHRAFPEWRRRPARERGQYLLAIADVVESRAEEIARLIATETGNALRPQARTEVASAVDILRYFGGVASELKGSVIPLGEGVLSYTRPEPLGVAGAIVPWNAPVQLATMKMAMALAAGNTLVLKPAEDAPLAVLEVAEAGTEILPAGVLNVVTGLGEEAGEALTRHRLVRKLSFTGSTEVGRLVMTQAARRLVPVSLELGGKNPVIVFPDSDDLASVDGVISGMRFTRQGQSCTAGSRMYVHADIYESFLGRLAGRLAELQVGDPLREETDMGALINEKQYRRVRGYIEREMNADGSRVVLGGLPDESGPLGEGYYVEPTLIADVDKMSPSARDEIFGPVLVAAPWDEEEEVVTLANDSDFGLAAYVWCHDISRALSVGHRLEAGWVQINQGTGQSLGQPYGGTKESGIGREFSLEGMVEGYTTPKAMTVNLRK